MNIFKRLFRKWKFVSMVPEGRDYIITFKSGNDIKQYYGNCTVWHTFPDFHRCFLLKECELSDIWTRERYRIKKKLLDENRTTV